MQENKNARSSGSKNKAKRSSHAQHLIWFANVVLIVLILMCGFVYLLFFKRDKISKEENRTLAKLPKLTLSSYMSGEFTEGLADYYDDTVPNRSWFKTVIASKLMPLKGRAYGSDEDAVELHGDGFEHLNKNKSTVTVTTTAPAAVTTTAKQSGNAPAATTEIAEQTTAAPDEEAQDEGNGEMTNNILVVNKRGLTLYGGGYGRELDYADYVNTYKSYFGDSVNVYSMVIPTAVSFYMPESYADLTALEKPDIDTIAGALNNVTPVDAYSVLGEHSSEPIYSRTDHHWQALGAYYAAGEFAKDAGVPFADISEYNKVTLPGYVGTLYGYTQSAVLINNPEDFIYYEPKEMPECENYSTAFTDPYPTSLFIDPANLDTSSYYLVFGSDERIAHVHNSAVGNGRKLVIFKDSYGNALLPFLTGSFEDIYLCDIRYFDKNSLSFISEVGATDLLFAMCSFSAVGQNRLCIYNNMYK